MRSRNYRLLTKVIAAILFAVVTTLAQTNEFTYQGKISVTGAPSANYDFEFNLCNDANCGSILDTNSRLAVPVSDGVFTVKLNFAPGEFYGSDRYLEIRVKRPSEMTFTTLLPREKITSAPYSIQAAKATNALFLGGVAANQFVLTTDGRLSDARPPLPGSPDYVQNTTPGAGFNFNIDGIGSANILNAATQFNIGGQRILSNAGFRNLIVGINAGTVNSGIDNAFFGVNAGSSNLAASRNSFFGSGAGLANTGGSNSFFGAAAGFDNTSGEANSFFGNNSGLRNTSGSRNSFFGEGTGFNNTIGSDNSFFGRVSGVNNTGGSNNTFIGSRSGFSNSTGFENTFVGQGAGENNSTASRNAFLGAGAGFSNNLGARNTFVGNTAGWANTSGNDNAFFGYQAGLGNTTAGSNAFFGTSAGRANTADGNSFFGSSAGFANTTGIDNAFFGLVAGWQNTTGSSNTLIGTRAGANSTVGNNNVFIGSGAGNPNTSTQVSNSIAIGTGVTVSTSNTIVLGTTVQSTQIFGGVRAGIFNGLASVSALDVVNSPAGGGVVAPNLYIRSFAQGGSGIHLCWKAAADGIPGNVITNCTSPFSEGTLKQGIEPFTLGLSIIERLKPVAFKWKADGSSDVGLNAEDVELVAPDFVTRNVKGEAEGVKEHSLNVVFINAFKEQQEQIATQRREIEMLRRQIAALNKLICLSNEQAEVCKDELK